MNLQAARLVIDVVIIPIMSFAVYVLMDLSKSVASLNTNVGILISKNEGLEKRVDKLEDIVFKKADK